MCEINFLKIINKISSKFYVNQPIGSESIFDFLTFSFLSDKFRDAIPEVLMKSCN